MFEVKGSLRVDINSHNRISGSHSNMTYKLPIPAGSKFDRVVLLKASIPKSYYLISNNRNTFTLNELAASQEIKVPAGVYDRDTFQTTLQVLLDAASTTMGHNWQYTISYPDPSVVDTGKYTFTVANNGGAQPSFTLGNYMFEQLGFDSDTTVTFENDTLESTNVLKFRIEDTLYIHSTICQDGVSDVLETIFTSSAIGYGTISYVTPDWQICSRPFATNDRNIFNFAITDEDGTPIELNGLNWCATIALFSSASIIDEFSRLTTSLIAEQSKLNTALIAEISKLTSSLAILTEKFDKLLQIANRPDSVDRHDSVAALDAPRSASATESVNL